MESKDKGLEPTQPRAVSSNISMDRIFDAWEESKRKYPTNEALDTAVKNGEIRSMVGFQFPRKDEPERE
jgi:hypothetical protein